MVTQRAESSFGQPILLNPDLKSPKAQEFEDKLGDRIIGQTRAVRKVAGLYQIHLAGMQQKGHPVGNLLFLGPTGSGKTRVVEAAAEVLFGDANSVIKIDCAEFQHSHEIAKIIGSPPGYLGHRETSPILTQENLDRYHTERDKLSFVLFDEIEKASDSLWQLLLGILDKATLTLGDNRRVDFSRTIIFMTSNLGAREMTELITGSIGFKPEKKATKTQSCPADLDKKIYHTALDAARKKFSPEFMNRIDKTVVFRSLDDDQLWDILYLELKEVQQRILRGTGDKFIFQCTDTAKEFLLAEGTDYRYGARPLKRTLERFLVLPFSNFVASRQIKMGDLVIVDFDPEDEKLTFTKEERGALVSEFGAEYIEHFAPPTKRSRAVVELPKVGEQQTKIVKAGGDPHRSSRGNEHVRRDRNE